MYLVKTQKDIMKIVHDVSRLMTLYIYITVIKIKIEENCPNSKCFLNFNIFNNVQAMQQAQITQSV